MAALREIRTRMKSVQETMKITNAMYLISSSKLKRAKKQLEQTEPYFSRLQTTIASILDHAPDIRHAYFDTHPKKQQKTRGYIVISGDKGLCGAYNHNVVQFAEQEITSEENAVVFLVGAKGRKYFNKKGLSFDGEFLYVIQNPTTRKADMIAESVLRLFTKGHLDEVYIVYTRMLTSVKTQPEIIKLLPLEKHEFAETQQG